MKTAANGRRVIAILEWARAKGEPKAVDRMRVIVLPALMREGVRFNNLTHLSELSIGAVDAVKAAAAKVVGTPCPI
jgi:hypothetical protein